MKTNLVITIVLNFLFLLSSCGITSISPDKLSQVRTIGAMSLLGDELHIAQVGTTVFNNLDKDEKAGWAIDRFTTEKIKNILAGKTKLRFVDIDEAELGFASQNVFDLLRRKPIDRPAGLFVFVEVVKYGGAYLRDVQLVPQKGHRADSSNLRELVGRNRGNAAAGKQKKKIKDNGDN